MIGVVLAVSVAVLFSNMLVAALQDWLGRASTHQREARFRNLQQREAQEALRAPNDRRLH